MKISNKRRLSVFNKYGGRCAYCGCEITFDDFEPDHIISRSSLKAERRAANSIVLIGYPALDALDNLNPSCKECNRQKWDRSIEGFRQYIKQTSDDFLQANPKFSLLAKYGLASIKSSDILFHFEKTGNE